MVIERNYRKEFIDDWEFNQEIISNSKKGTYIMGNFLPFSEKPNTNGRIYNYDSIDISNYLDLIKNHKAVGELAIDHHSEFEISLTHTSHKITKLRKTKLGIVGEVQLLNTTSGMLAKTMLSNLIVRPCLIGYVNSNGIVNINEIISFDLVHRFNDGFNPSSHKNIRYKLNK